jgi:hypothetical protein
MNDLFPSQIPAYQQAWQQSWSAIISPMDELYEAKLVALDLARNRDKVGADDVRFVMEQRKMRIPENLGGLFDTKTFKKVGGPRRSKHPASHGHYICDWALRT